VCLYAEVPPFAPTLRAGTYSGTPGVAIRRSRCEGEVGGNLKGFFAPLRTRLRRFTPRIDTLLNAFVLIQLALGKSENKQIACPQGREIYSISIFVFEKNTLLFSKSKG
jgi:hypothetical protein